MINGASLHNWLTWHRITSATYILFFRDLELWIKSARGRHSLKSCLNAGLCVTWRRGQDGGSGRRAVLLIPSYSANPSGIVTFMSQLWQCGLNALLSKSCSDRHYYMSWFDLQSEGKMKVLFSLNSLFSKYCRKTINHTPPMDVLLRKELFFLLNFRCMNCVFF